MLKEKVSLYQKHDGACWGKIFETILLKLSNLRNKQRRFLERTTKNPFHGATHIHHGRERGKNSFYQNKEVGIQNKLKMVACSVKRNKQEASKDTIKTESQKQTFYNMYSNPKKSILIKKELKK